MSLLDQSLHAASSVRRCALGPSGTLKTSQRGKADVGEMLRVYLGQLDSEQFQAGRNDPKREESVKNRSSWQQENFRSIFLQRINLLQGPFDRQAADLLSAEQALLLHTALLLFSASPVPSRCDAPAAGWLRPFAWLTPLTRHVHGDAQTPVLSLRRSLLFWTGGRSGSTSLCRVFTGAP